MRDHLATLIDDFRGFGREIAVVRYQGNRRRVTSYSESPRGPAGLPPSSPHAVSRPAIV